jgi:CBS domain containing-hemolysin-like protein
MADLLMVLIIFGLVFANGLFVAAEFALVGAPRPAIQELAAAGHRRAAMVLPYHTDSVLQDRYVATAQVGITLASLGLGMYGEHAMSGWIREALISIGIPDSLRPAAAASFFAVAILAYLHIVLGEMVPKSLALTGAEKSALRLIPVMIAAEKIFFPLVFTLNAVGAVILRVLGIAREIGGGEHVHTPEELQLIVEESTQSGLLRRIPGLVLQELIEFSELAAHEVMVPRVRIAGVPVGASTDHLRRIILEAPHTRYPVYVEDRDHIIGLIHVKDLLRIILDERDVTAHDARPVPRIPETTTLDTVLEVMRKDGSQAVVVMDEHGGTAGLITMEDLFEEVVGEIDEGAGEPPEIRKEGAGVRARGTARLEHVGEALDRYLEHDDVDTVSGLVLAILERPPRVGDVVQFLEFRFEVTAVEWHGVEECLITIDL